MLVSLGKIRIVKMCVKESEGRELSCVCEGVVKGK